MPDIYLSPGASAPADIILRDPTTVPAGGPAYITNAGGIGSEEALGAPAIVVVLAPTGIAGAEAFGTASFSLTLAPAAIPSEEAFGVPTVTPVTGAVTLYPDGIPSEESFGAPDVWPSQVITLAPVFHGGQGAGDERVQQPAAPRMYPLSGSRPFKARPPRGGWKRPLGRGTFKGIG